MIENLRCVRAMPSPQPDRLTEAAASKSRTRHRCSIAYASSVAAHSPPSRIQRHAPLSWVVYIAQVRDDPTSARLLPDVRSLSSGGFLFLGMSFIFYEPTVIFLFFFFSILTSDSGLLNLCETRCVVFLNLRHCDDAPSHS